MKKGELAVEFGLLQSSFLPPSAFCWVEHIRCVTHKCIYGKVVEHLTLEAICKHMKDKKIIRSSQCGFTKGKSYVTSLMSFCDEMTTLFYKERVGSEVG